MNSEGLWQRLLNMSTIKFYVLLAIVVYGSFTLIWAVKYSDMSGAQPVNIVEIHSNRCGCIRAYIPGEHDTSCYLPLTWSNRGVIQVEEDGFLWWHKVPLEPNATIKTDIYIIHINNYTVKTDETGYSLVTINETLTYDPKAALIKSVILATTIYITFLAAGIIVTLRGV